MSKENKKEEKDEKVEKDKREKRHKKDKKEEKDIKQKKDKKEEKDEKVQQSFIIESFADQKILEQYSQDAAEIGLWEVEKLLIEKYFPREGKILDIGCGAGRTTFGLAKLGYEDIIGIDITPGMIEKAKNNTRKLGEDILFEVGDACNLKYRDNYFAGCLFSFNGIMQIPERDKRIEAFKEIHRVLRKNGVFIFSTHVRDSDPEWKSFWEEEKERWAKGEQDSRIFEYGDRIVEEDGRLIFLHFPDREEVVSYLKAAGLKLIDEVWLFEEVEESEAVKERASKCKMWVAKK